MVMPWFCGRDVCEILGYANYRNALAEHIESDCKHQLGNILGVCVKQKYTYNERKMTYIHKRGLEMLSFEYIKLFRIRVESEKLTIELFLDVRLPRVFFRFISIAMT
jgi:hypothetical protein